MGGVRREEEGGADLKVLATESLSSTTNDGTGRRDQPGQHTQDTYRPTTNAAFDHVPLPWPHLLPFPSPAPPLASHSSVLWAPTRTK